MSGEDLMLARAKLAWDAAKREDDEAVREASELRLTRMRPQPGIAPARAFALGAAAALALVALLFAVGRPARSAAPLVAGGASVASAATEPPGAPAVTAPRASTAPAARRAARVVATSACAECRIEPGAAIDTRIVVPGGARLTLGFALDDGLVDPTTGVDLTGPASASTSESGTLVIERGVVRVRTRAGSAVDVPGGHLTSDDAVYAVRVDERGTARVEVERGIVSVTTREALELKASAGGAPLEIDAAGGAHAAVTPATVPRAPATDDPSPRVAAPTVVTTAASTDDAYENARLRARKGDATGRTDLERLAASPDARVARRASFTLAELELASGARAEARARLDALLVCPEAGLAADAATLLARSHPAPADRAEVWSRFLATKPASPYRERALLERAEALLDGGRIAEAKGILAELRRGGRLTPAQERQLERLDLKAR